MAVGRALVLHPRLEAGGDGRALAGRLAEAEGLARAIGLEVVATLAVPLGRPHPGSLFRPGKIAEIAERVTSDAISLVVVDRALTPVQQRNLERAWKTKVIDRTGLILEIFGARARTREGALQVELAALSYQRSRLVRSWTHLERQRGGLGFVGGPGESQLEVDRRLIDERLVRIRRELAGVSRTRSLHRRARQKVPYPVVALVGYTNAGKSTLFNRLTAAEVVAADALFATLDPTLRGVSLPSGRRIILSDTVGFISELPTTLIAAFRATLEEVRAADLIVHVRDISHPESEAQRRDVHAVLSELGLEATVEEGGLVEVLNKLDRLDDETRAWICNRASRAPNQVALSALTGEGVEALLALIDRRLGADRRVVDLALPHAEGAALAWLYAHGEVLAREDAADGVHLRVGLSPTDAGRFRRRFSDRWEVEERAAVRRA